MSNAVDRSFFNRLQALSSRFRVTEQYLVGNSPGNVLLVANPLRATILWSVHSSDVALLSTIPNALPGQGIMLIDTQQPLLMTMRTHGGLVQDAWYAGGITHPFQITVLTVDYHEDW